MNQFEILSLEIQALLLVVTGVGVGVYLSQLKAMRESHHQSLIIQRRELYYKTTSLSDEEISTMMLHLADHFDPEIYRKRYHGEPLRVNIYFLMKRKYLYLLLSTYYKENKRDPAGKAPLTWLKELCKYQEFRDVHASQGKYYPSFKRIVDGILESTIANDPVWAIEESVRIASPD